jgi:hypothetical protein
MSVIRYRSVCRYAGAWLDEPIARPIPLDEIDTIAGSTGIYIACEPLERVQYVGSVCRPLRRNAIAARLREHRREGHKRMGWKTVWVVRLKVDTPLGVVRLIEGCIGTDLGPLGANRLPRLSS